ncbi:MAG TPA: hypothetical protein VID29_10770 [Solirubrobacteraceae bacterium]|jgi:hypothetical protein
MAQTKRKRQTKHRGNAAGVVESRGRTGRKPTSAEKSREGRERASGREARLNRYDTPPTWRSAFYRAMAAAVLMLLVSLLLIKNHNQAIAIFPIVLAIYVPISYYTDLWLYRRRQRNKAARGEQSKREDAR